VGQECVGVDFFSGRQILGPELRHADLDQPLRVLSHYAPEQRLAGIDPEQRLAGLDRDHQALALPLEVLRALPDSYIRSLSPEAQEAIRRRRRDAGG
jgi:hypothetical protein